MDVRMLGGGRPFILEVHDPQRPTAFADVAERRAMEAALESAGMGDLSGKRVGIQGCGNVGRPLMQFLLEKGVASIVATVPGTSTGRTYGGASRGANERAPRSYRCPESAKRMCHADM